MQSVWNRNCTREPQDGSQYLQGDPRLSAAAPFAIATKAREDGPALVFIHGFLVDGRALAQGDRRETTNWHAPRIRARSATRLAHDPAWTTTPTCLPRASRKLIAEFIEALDLDEVTLIGNDTGGALTQAATEHPGPIARMVLTTCDSFDEFPPEAVQAADGPAARGAEVGLRPAGGR